MVRKLSVLVTLVFVAMPFVAKADAIGSIQTDLYISIDSSAYYGWNSASRYSLTDFYNVTTDIYGSADIFQDNPSGVIGINAEPNRLLNEFLPPGSSVQSEFAVSQSDDDSYLYRITATSTVTADTGSSNRLAYVVGQQSLALYFPAVEAGNSLIYSFSLSTTLNNESVEDSSFNRIVYGDYWSSYIYAGYYDVQGNYLGTLELWNFINGAGFYRGPGESTFYNYGGPQSFIFDPDKEFEGAAVGYYMHMYNVSNQVQEVNYYPSQPDDNAVVPEPSSLILLGSGFAGIALLVRRRIR
ncbi:MAG: PEP-CTERM sorting domain-containing protein [Acidobacteria bacterium]|nr:PEP-CTERM sorting domain-containing protein [Acidobacteriota bacterium]